jgi:hypothetical protein
LAARGADVSNLRNNRILALIPDALRMLVDQGYLRKTFDVTAVNGAADLTSPLADIEPLILEQIRKATITFDGFTYPLQWRADRSSASYPSTSEFGYCFLEDKTLHVVNENGIGDYDGAGKIRNAPFLAQISSVTAGLEALFISTLANLANAQNTAKVA